MTDYFDELGLAGLFQATNVERPLPIPNGSLADDATVTGAILKQWINQHAAALDPLVFVKPNRAAFALMLKINFIRGQIGNTRPLATAVAPGFVFMDTGNDDAITWSDSVAWRPISTTDTMLDIALYSLRNRVDAKVGIDIIDQLKGTATTQGDTLGELQALITALQTALSAKLATADLQSALSDKTLAQSQVTGLASALGGKIDATQKGALNGVATLDGSGKVPSAQLPSYVDDVIEVANYAALPSTGVVSAIYVTLNDNKQYRWGGSAYIELTSSPGTTDAVPEGATNKYFTDARARAAITGLSDVPGLTDALSAKQRKPVATYAAARALTGLADGEIIEVAGAAALGDGGHGSFRVASGSQADDGLFTLVTSDGKRLHRLRYYGEVRSGWAGLDRTGATSVSAALANAVEAAYADNGGEIFLAPGDYKMTTEVPMKNGVEVAGPLIVESPTRGARIVWSDPSLTPFKQSRSDIGGSLKNLVFQQAQPAIASGWAPTVYPAAIRILNGSCRLQSLYFLGIHRGIELGSPTENTGREVIDDIHGEFFDYGLHVHYCQDVLRVSRWHQWPFWSAYNSAVKAWTRANARGFILKKVDNPQISNGFVIGAKRGLELAAGGVGNIVGGMVSNFDLDNSACGVYVESNGNTIDFANLKVQPGPDTGPADSRCMDIVGSNNLINVANGNFARANAELIKVAGAGNRLGLANFKGQAWDDLAAGGINAINAAAGNRVTLSGDVLFNPFNATAGALGGTMSSFRWRDAAGGRANFVTNSSGRIVIPHGLGFAPPRITAMSVTPGYDFYCQATSADATNINVRVRDLVVGAEVTTAGVTVTVEWEAFC